MLVLLIVWTSAEEGVGHDHRYDPLAGMEESGRIPQIDMPADIAHPERWRYVPAGRIPPGNPFERFFVTSFIVWYAIKLTMGLRVTEQEEMEGIDLHEFGMEAYPDFAAQKA